MINILLPIFAGFMIFLSCGVNQYIEASRICYHRGLYDKGLKYAIKATNQLPDNPEAWYLLGEFYGHKDNPDSMIIAFDASKNLSDIYEDEINNTKNYYYNMYYSGASEKLKKFELLQDNPELLIASKKSIDKAIQIEKTEEALKLKKEIIDILNRKHENN